MFVFSIREIGPYFDFIEAYSKKCLDNIAQKVVNVMIYTTRNQMKLFCYRRRTQRQFMEAAKCTNAGEKLMNGCYNQFIDSLQGAVHAIDKLRIPLACW